MIEQIRSQQKVAPTLNIEEVSRHHASVSQDAETGLLNVKLVPFWKIAPTPHRIAPGHGACPGCGAFTTFKQFFRILDGDVVVLFQTGCAMVVTTGYPNTAHRITYIHNLFQNGAATLSGLVEMYHERARRGELPATYEPTFVMVTGDGGMDIGMGAALGTANRNHRMILIEYDNEGYMNTGGQLSYSTPLGHKTSTSPTGSESMGKVFHHKDTPQIFAAANVPYVFTAIEGFPEDLMKKAAKAQWYARREGFVYGKILSSSGANIVSSLTLNVSTSIAFPVSKESNFPILSCFLFSARVSTLFIQKNIIKIYWTATKKMTANATSILSGLL